VVLRILQIPKTEIMGPIPLDVGIKKERGRKMRITCNECGEIVSTELPHHAVFRAIAICPECIEKLEQENAKLCDQISNRAKTLDCQYCGKTNRVQIA